MRAQDSQVASQAERTWFIRTSRCEHPHQPRDGPVHPRDSQTEAALAAVERRVNSLVPARTFTLCYQTLRLDRDQPTVRQGQPHSRHLTADQTPRLRRWLLIAAAQRAAVATMAASPRDRRPVRGRIRRCRAARLPRRATRVISSPSSPSSNRYRPDHACRSNPERPEQSIALRRQTTQAELLPLRTLGFAPPRGIIEQRDADLPPRLSCPRRRDHLRVARRRRPVRRARSVLAHHSDRSDHVPRDSTGPNSAHEHYCVRSGRSRYSRRNGRSSAAAASEPVAGPLDRARLDHVPTTNGRGC